MPISSRNAPFTSPPQMRGWLRMTIGKTVFSLKRYLSWLKSRDHLQKSAHSLPFTVFSHKTPLLRNLGKEHMPLQHNKITNLKLALPRLNGIILRPGDTFSFWRLVGKPTRRKGYIEGLVLHNGTCGAGLGGGLCQLSNLIYWMTLHTPLTVIERWRHNYDVFPDAERTQPFGSGATVVYNYVDLQIRNQTEDIYRLNLALDDVCLGGGWQCEHAPDRRYDVYESEHCITSQWWGGYTRKNTLRRKITDQEGTLIGDEFICTNEAIMMYEPLLTSPQT